MIMATISENLQTIKNSTDAIKQAIIDKGGTIEGDITTWASAINGISGGGSSSGGAGSVFKITNKLNGRLFGGPTYSTNGSDEVLHEYSFEGGELASNTIIANYNPNYTGYELFPNSNTFGYSYSEAAGVSTSATNSCGNFSVYTNTQGKLFLNSYADGASNLTCPLIYIAFDTEGNYDVDFFSVQTALACLLKDTNITLSDYSTKLIQDITYNDVLLVWNFDEGKYDKAKPLWIKKTQQNTFYYKVVLEDGTVFNCTGSKGHRMFNIDKNTFLYPEDCLNNFVYTNSGSKKVVSCELIEEECEYYNIITDYHMNLFADDILTSCRYNNLYPIQDMKFVKDDRMQRAPKWKLYEQFRDHKCLLRYIEGLRLYEQLDIPLSDTIKYCERLESLRKTLDEFEGNEKLLKKIEDTEVGWIDRNGNVYGFKHYMPGQYNHIILSDKICKELNVQTDNPSRYLEKLGWVKYTTDFILNSDDEYINKKQLNVIKKFLNIPGKCKKEGFIKIGTAFDDYTSISDFEKMDEYSFEFRKRNSNKNNYKKWQQDK
jgi:hypothetical protein